MTTIGLKAKDSVNENIITPQTATIISCGTVTMPNALNGDGTYGLDIDLPGAEAIPVSKIGVIILPHGNIHWTAEVRYTSLVWDGVNYYVPSIFLDDYYTYYTKNDETGVMTLLTPGNRTPGVIGTWDGICSVFPLYGWDRVSANITAVRLWAVTCYIILDGMSDFKAVYSIGNTGGIEQVDYAIFLKEWNY